MASDSRNSYTYVNFGSYVTYGAPRKWSTAYTRQSNRARNWERLFKTKREALVRLLAQGYLPTTRYTDDLQETVNSKVVTFKGLFNTDPRSTYEWSIIPGYSRYPVSVSTDPMVASLVASVLANLQSKISGNGTNLLVSATEARQTIGMIGDAALKLSVAYRHVRHGNFRAGALALGLEKTPKRVSRRESFGNNWLQYRYGWRLVVQDIASLMKTLYDSLTTRPPVLRVTSWNANERNYTWNRGEHSWFLPSGEKLCTFNVTQRTQFLTEVRGGYVYQLENVALATGQSFGVVNYLTFAWETIPYSFVLDWIFNVGSVLEGLTAFQGKKFLDGWICKSIQSSTTHQWSALKKTSEVFSMSDSGERLFGPVIERRFVRELTGFTPSSIRLDLNLNTARVTDAAALLKQQALRK